MLTRHLAWTVLSIVVVVIIVGGIVLSFIDEPLRGYAVDKVTESLPGYQVQIGRLNLYPFTLSVELHDVVIRQKAFPDLPLVAVPLISADAKLLPLFIGEVGAEIAIDQLALSVTKEQLASLLDTTTHDLDVSERAKEEVKEETAAWQERIRSKMAFTIDLRMRQCKVSVAAPQFAEPVQIQNLDLTVENVTNRPDKDEPYPTTVKIDAQLLESAHLTVDGHVAPLAKPLPAIDVQFSLQKVDLLTALKLAGRTDTPVQEGIAEVAGRLLYGPSDRSMTIEYVALQGLKVDYVRNPESPALQSDVAQAANVAEAWQDQVMALFPVTIKEASIQGADVVYRAGVKAEPIQIHPLDFTIRNVTNRSDAHEYPSEFQVGASLSEQARISLEGRANLLVKPVPNISAHVKVERLKIDSLRSLIGHFNVQLQQGTLDAHGQVDYAHQRTKVAVDDFLLEQAKIDYVHKAATKAKETARLKKGARKAKEVHQDPRVLVTVEQGKILHSDIGFVNTATSPDYRVFFSDMNVDMDNFSNRLEKGTGVIKITGNFMGSGPSIISGTFRPEKPTPDFSMAVKIIKTKVPSMNNVLRAYNQIDTHAGWFAFFSELSVKGNRIEGYVKPLLKDVETYDPQQDRDKALTQKMYEAVVEGIMDFLSNKPRGEVATQTDVSGQVENPESSTWEIVEKLIQNAFFKAILPAFGRV